MKKEPIIKLIPISRKHKPQRKSLIKLRPCCCKKVETTLQELEDDFYLTQVLGIPLK